MIATRWPKNHERIAQICKAIYQIWELKLQPSQKAALLGSQITYHQTAPEKMWGLPYQPTKNPFNKPCFQAPYHLIISRGGLPGGIGESTLRFPCFFRFIQLSQLGLGDWKLLKGRRLQGGRCGASSQRPRGSTSGAFGIIWIHIPIGNPMGRGRIFLHTWIPLIHMVFL